MRKKKIWITILIILVLVSGVCWYIAGRNLSISIGRCVVADNGSYMYVEDRSPIVMSNQTENAELFSGLETGDKILVVHDGIRESYPGGTGAYYCKKLQDGNLSDIDGSVIYELTELGWINQGLLERMSSVSLTCGEKQISIKLPDNWAYEVNEKEEGPYGGNGFISFWPKDETEGKLYVSYFETGFGVCGTGLSKKETVIARMAAEIGTYDNDPMWSFISFFPDVQDVAIINSGVEKWWSQYENEAMFILHTLEIK